MVSTYTYFNFGVRSGVHLHIFQFWGPKWGPFTHISILGSEMVSIYTYFNFGVRNDVHLHIFQIWGPEMVFIYTYFKFGPRCGLNNPINRVAKQQMDSGGRRTSSQNSVRPEGPKGPN